MHEQEKRKKNRIQSVVHLLVSKFLVRAYQNLLLCFCMSHAREEFRRPIQTSLDKV